MSRASAPLRRPLVSNIDGGLLTTADEVMQELSDQICEAVEWVRCMGTMVNQGIADVCGSGAGPEPVQHRPALQSTLPFVSIEDARADDLAAFGRPVESRQPA